MRLLITLLLFPFICKSQVLVEYAYSSNFYISSTGNDLNNGASSSYPWKTLARANRHTFRPGDTLNIKGGEIFTGNLIMDDSGVPGSPIVVKNYGTGRPQINCGTGTGIEILNASYVQVDSMYVQGSGVDTTTGVTSSIGYAVSIKSTETTGARRKGIMVKNSVLIGCRIGVLVQKDARQFPQTSYRGYDSVVIYGNDISNCGFAGIFTWARSNLLNYDPGAFSRSTVKNIDTNIIVQRNKVHDNFGYITSNYALANHGTGVRIMNVDGGVVEYNWLDNNGHVGSAYGYPANFEAENARNITWQYNESSRCKFANISYFDGAGFDVFDGGTSYMTVQYNYIRDNDGYGIGGGGTGLPDDSGSTNNNVARFNLLVNNNQKATAGLGDVQMWGGYSSYKFYNNTVYSSLNSSYMVSILAPVTGYFTNNIFVSVGDRPILYCPNAGYLPSLLNNLYYRGASNDSLGIIIGGTTYNTLAALHAAGFEKLSGINYGVVGNPNFLSVNHSNFLMGANVSTQTGFNLQGGSAALGTGLPMLTIAGFNEGTKDFHNSTIVNITNIGAMQ